MSNIIIVENNSEIAAGTRGSSLGLEAIKVAAVNKNEDVFLKYTAINIKNENHRVWKNVRNVYAKRIGGVIKIYNRIVEGILPVLQKGDFPLIISGDHSSAGGSIAALKLAFPEKRVGVVWIDAHADLHSPYTTPSGNMHGMPLASALAEDNLEQKINKPIKETVEKWDLLKNLGGISPKLLTKDLVFVGVRSVEKPEMAIIDRYSIPNYTLDELVKKGVDDIASKIFQNLKDTEIIYISFDVDSMDMELSEGTGTPVKKGLSKEQAIELIKKLLEDKRVKMFEVVEVNPLLDKKGNLMAEMALEAIIEVINVVEGR